MPATKHAPAPAPAPDPSVRIGSVEAPDAAAAFDMWTQQLSASHYGALGDLSAAADIAQGALDRGDAGGYEAAAASTQMLAEQTDGMRTESRSVLDAAIAEFGAVTAGAATADSRLGTWERNADLAAGTIATSLVPQTFAGARVAEIPTFLEPSSLAKTAEVNTHTGLELVQLAERAAATAVAGGTDAASALATATDLAIGPLAHFDPDGGEIDYLLGAVAHSGAPEAVHTATASILGRGDEAARNDGSFLGDEGWDRAQWNNDLEIESLFYRLLFLGIEPDPALFAPPAGEDEFCALPADPASGGSGTDPIYGPFADPAMYGPEWAPDAVDVGEVPTTSFGAPEGPTFAIDDSAPMGPSLQPRSKLDVRLGAAPGELSAGVGRSGSTVGDSGKTTSAKAGLDAKASGDNLSIAASARIDHGEKDAEDKWVDHIGAGVSGQITTNGTEVAAAGSADLTLKPENGPSTSYKANASLGTEKGSVGGSRTVTTEYQDAKTGEIKSRTTGGGGSVEIDWETGGVSLSGFAQYGGFNVRMSRSGRKTRFFPVEVLGKDNYRVRFGVERGTSASAGYSETSGSASAGASAGLKQSREVVGSRVFGSLEEAKAFWSGGDVSDELEADAGIPDASEALRMAEGEVRGVNNDTAVEGGVSGSYGIFGVGAGVSHAEGRGMTVERGSGKTVLVEIRDTSAIAASGYLSVGPVQAGRSEGTGDIDSLKVAFDLGAEAGERAYAYFAASGKLPPTPNGYRIKVKTKAEVRSSETSLKAPVITMSERKQMIEGISTDDADNKQEFSVGTNARGIKANLAWWNLGHYNADHTMEAVQVNDDRTWYTTRSTVDSGDGAVSAYEGLWEATHRSKESRDPGGASKGKWTVTSVFSEEEIAQFRDRIVTERMQPDWHIEGDVAGAKKLMASADADDQRRGVAMYVAEGGRYGVADLRRGAAGGSQSAGDARDYHLELAGDPYWTGFRGAKMTEAEIAAYRRRVAAAAGHDELNGLLVEIQHSLHLQRERRAKIPAYREVPADLVAQEIARTQGYIDQLSEIASTIGERTVDDDQMSSRFADQNPDSVRLIDAQDYARARRSEVADRRSLAYRKYRIAMHGGFFDATVNERKSAYNVLPSMRPRLDRAARAWSSGEAAFTRAEASMQRIAKAVGEFGGASLGAAMAVRAAAEYQRARRHFDEAVSTFDEVRGLYDEHRTANTLYHHVHPSGEGAYAIEDNSAETVTFPGR